ncbi:serpin family protein [Paenibacillus spongiae]|uniref:Serpin family protein n=1 Tax=Paenibacillus spongiae TaxID=2909671 RepID=A0ABY5SCA0_9BACL|nr:serpin family protein [Paenibacillus spongiae]UVI31586.1 serpin family protein [Paenibacillus spongiae]
MHSKTLCIGMRTAAALLAIMILVMTVGCGNDSKKLTFTNSDVNVRQIQAYNKFSLQMTEQLLQEARGDNVFVSPLSMTFALSLAMNGAGGNTLKEMKAALQTDDIALEAINQGSQVLRHLLEQSDPEVELDIANALWLRKGISLNEAFVEQNKRYFDAQIHELDFSAESAVHTINKWVKKQTRKKIDRILESSIPDQTRLLLMNAIYFKAGWQKAFEADATHDAPFRLMGGSTVTVPMMRQTDNFEYLNGGGRYEAIRLPYSQGTWNMIIVLPGEEVTLDELEAELLRKPEMWRSGYTEGKGIIELPRFNITYKAKLNDALQSLGMKEAFASEHADFSGMIKDQSTLFIGNVVHKAFIEVNEQGTEAAAVTSIQMDGSSESPQYDFRMTVNRPFFFAVEEQKTGALVFLGSIKDPTKE